MKQLILLISIVLLSISSLFAQTFGGGFLGGFSASQLDGDNWGGYNKAGLTVGVYTSTKLTKYVDAQLELRYVQKGSKSTGDDQSVFYLSKLNYIELPLLLKYTFLDKFNANIGISIGYLQKATEDKDGIGDYPAEPPFKEFEFSGLAGVEYQITEKLFLNIRFNYSILPVRSHPGDQAFYLNRGQYNNVLTFAVYYQLANFGK